MRRLGKGKLKLIIPIIIVVIIVGIIILTNINVLNKLRANVFESSDVKETKESTCDVENISDSYIKITGTIDQDYGEDGLATITFTDGNKSFTKELEVKTNSKTKLDFTLSKGEYNLSVSKEGYDVYEGKINTSQELNITLHNKNVGDVVATGQVGDNVYYNYYSNGLLQLKGTGPTWENEVDGYGCVNSFDKYHGGIINDVIAKKIANSNLDFPEDYNEIYGVLSIILQEFGPIEINKAKDNLENGTCPDENNSDCDLVTALLEILEKEKVIKLLSVMANISPVSRVEINDGITYLGNGMLSYIHADELIIPNSVHDYGIGVLRDTKINNLVLSANASSLSKYLLSSSDFKEIKIPKGVKRIESDSFLFSTIGSLYIPDTVDTINRNAFYGTEINNLTIANFKNDYLLGASTLDGFVKIDELVINGNNNFRVGGMYAIINKLVFPDMYKGTVTNSYCANYTTIKKVSLGKNTNLPKHGYGVAFNNCSVRYVEVNQENADGYSLFLNKLNNNNKNVEVVFKDGVKTISNFNKDLYSKVTFPDTLRKIEKEAFKNAIITEVAIPSSVTVIGDNAFNKYKLESVTIAGNETRFNTRWTTIGFPENLMP